MIHYGCVIALFLVTPLISVAAYGGLLVSTNVEVSAMFSYVTFCAILNVLIFLHFFISLIDIFERLKLENAKAFQHFEEVKKHLRKHLELSIPRRESYDYERSE